jgi:hypothetical protein
LSPEKLFDLPTTKLFSEHKKVPEKKKEPTADERPGSEMVAQRKIDELAKRWKYPGILGDSARLELKLEDARGYLGDFLTVNPVFGEKLRQFAAELAAYLERSAKKKIKSVIRPMNCLVWAPPGSGKSFFAEQAAKKIGAEFHGINISQLGGRDKLTAELAYVASRHKSATVVLIDELLADLEGDLCLSLLLAPLWDGKVFHDGKEHFLPKPIVFALVDSSDKAQNAVELREVIGKINAKGPDFVSRLNGPPLTLEALSPADRAYLVGLLVGRYHPDVGYIEKSALDRLVDDEESSPRRIEYVLEAVDPKDGAISFDDLIEAERRIDPNRSPPDKGDASVSWVRLIANQDRENRLRKK